MTFAIDDLAELKRRICLSDVISRSVNLSGGKKDRFGLCPFHAEKQASFSVNDAKGFYHCFGCGAHGDVLDWWQGSEGLTFREALERLRNEAGVLPGAATHETDSRQSRDAAKKQAIALSIWEDSLPIGGTPAEDYLRACRGISIELPDCLRFHPSLRFDPRASRKLPALIAAVVDLTGAVVAIQRTFLLPDGSGKAPIERPKRALGPVGHGAVCLAAAAPLIGIAEGIETGLSAMELFLVPVWCALGSNLSRIVLPTDANKVVVFADRGEAGEHAAASACTTLRLRGRMVTVRYPKRGKDFNDELKGRRRES